MEVQFETKMTVSSLYDFNLQHAFKKPITILAVAFGFVGILFFIKTLKWYYLALGILIIFYTPVQLLYSAFVKIKLIPAFQDTMTYILNDEGITIKCNDQSETTPWENCVKACNTKQSYFVYTSQKSAFIFPQKDMGAKNADVLKMIATHMDPSVVKIKFGGL